MLKLLTTITLIFSLLETKSQNLLTNGDFEYYSSLPYNFGQLDSAIGWSKLNDHPPVYPYASPDYFHTDGQGGVKLPNSNFGVVHPYSGNAIVGFITFAKNTSNYREYLSSRFLSPMVIGSGYKISFWLSNGETNHLCSYSSNHIGLLLSTETLRQNTHEPIAVTPQLEIPGQVWDTAWQNFSFNFIADSAYKYITVGNFFDDVSTDSILQINAIVPSAYYFIDKVEVTPLNTTPVTLTKFTANKEDRNVLLKWNSMHEINTKEFVIEHSNDGIIFFVVGNLNALGNYSSETKYVFIHTNPSAVNYYRLKMVDNDGRFTYSEIKKLSFNLNKIEMAVNPNPFNDDLSVNVSSNITTKADLLIMDATGRIMYKHVAMLSPGVNIIKIEAQKLSKGIYILEMTADNQKQTARIIKN